MSQINTDQIASNAGSTTALTIADNGGVTAANSVSASTVSATTSVTTINTNTDTVKSNAGSTTALTISDSGYVTKNALPSGLWQAYQNTNVVFAHNATITGFNSTGSNAYESGISFNNSNGRWTVPVAGKYMVCWQFYKGNTNAGVRVAFNANNAACAYCHDGTNAAGTQGLTGSQVVSLAANNYFHFTNITGSNITLAMYGAHCTVSAVLIG
tara:strand:+ start:405 stop:1043 length:639 start_codon:yes stop_codon:yes gene_type:complete